MGSEPPVYSAFVVVGFLALEIRDIKPHGTLFTHVSLSLRSLPKQCLPAVEIHDLCSFLSLTQFKAEPYTRGVGDKYCD